MEPTKAVTCRHCGQEMILDADSLGREVVCRHCGQSTLIASRSPTRGVPEGSEVYNIVTDTVTGVNVRWRDNVIQAAAIGVCILLGIPIGALVVPERVPGAIAGGLIGMVVGLFGSGIFLMVFRLICHIRGKHR
jgi:transcription elongation factor Elf1